MNIIALGDFAAKLSEHIKYGIPYIISSLNTESYVDNSYRFHLDDFKSPEDMEANAPDFSDFLKNISDNILFVVNGADIEANLSLVILEKIKHKNIKILYFKPKKDYLSLTKRLQENMVRKVLQEKTLSGVFDLMFLVSESEIESILGGLPILTRKRTILETISNMFNVIHSFTSSKPVFDASGEIPIGARIATFGYTDIENNLDKSFYDFNMVSHKRYFYAYPEKELETNSGLLGLINKNISDRNKNNGNMPKEKELQTNFNIYVSTYEQESCYFINYINLVQD